jgi:hypothetical protein
VLTQIHPQNPFHQPSVAARTRAQPPHGGPKHH